MTETLMLINGFLALAIIGGYWHLSKVLEQLHDIGEKMLTNNAETLAIHEKIAYELAYARELIESGASIADTDG